MWKAPATFTVKNADYRFLTYRKPGVKIGNVENHCRKVSDSFFIIRENDKKGNGSHYHAILCMKKEPHKGWYPKGVHIHLQKIGRPETLVGFKPPLPDFSAQENAEHLALDPVGAPPQIEEHFIDAAMIKARKRANRARNVENVLFYMSKDYKTTDPVRYTDYIYVHRGRSLPL